MASGLPGENVLRDEMPLRPPGSVDPSARAERCEVTNVVPENGTARGVARFAQAGTIPENHHGPRPCTSGRVDLERDEFRMNRHRALAYCLSMIFSENRYPLFRIML